MKRTFIALALGLMALPALAAGEGKTIEQPPDHPYAALEERPGVQLTRNSCGICHSTDYIAFQPPNQGQAFWEAEVGKMIKVYHAPIEEADAKVIADYLAKTY